MHLKNTENAKILLNKNLRVNFKDTKKLRLKIWQFSFAKPAVTDAIETRTKIQKN